MVRTKSCWTRSTRDRQSVLERRQKEIVWPGGTSSSWAITRRHVALSFIDRRRERLNECVFLSEREWRADRKAESFAAPCFIVCERQLASEGAPLYATLRKIKRSLSLSLRGERLKGIGKRRKMLEIRDGSIPRKWEKGSRTASSGFE